MHNILIVDDQVDILRILEREFRRHGEYSVAIANNPADALDLMEKSPVELVISDVRLGTHTGFSLLQEVNQRHPGVGTMLMTAYRSPAYRQQADALGVSYFLEKPFPVATLVTAVERFFEERATVDQAEAQKAPVENNDGTMAHFKPQDLVQLFCLNGRNVRITLTFDSGKPVGYIYIQRGRVLHAEWGEQKAEAAFHAMMHETDSNLSLQDWNETVEQTIQSDWELLLLESARLLDVNNEEEAIAAAAQEPPKPSVNAPPLPPPLEEPFADFWKIAQMPATK